MSDIRQWLCNGCHKLRESPSLPEGWSTIEMEVPSLDQWGSLDGGSKHVGLTLCRGCYLVTFRPALRVIRARSKAKDAKKV